MAETMTLTQTIVTGNNDQFSSQLPVEGASIERTSPTIPAAKVGALTTRTDDNTGVLTMESGHGFTDGQLVDVFWSGGTRRAMTIGTVASLSVPIDGGSGDVLPADETAITAMIPVEIEFVVDGDTVKGLAVSSARASAWIVFVDDADAVITDAIFRINTAGYGSGWVEGAVWDNPLAGAVTSVVRFSHGGSDAAYAMKAAAVFGTPP